MDYGTQAFDSLRVMAGKRIEISGMKIVVFVEKRMNRKILLLACSIMIHWNVCAQTNVVPATDKKFSPRNYVEIHLTQPIVNQVHIGYGRFIHPRWSLESEIGAKYKWPTTQTYSINREGLWWGDFAAELHQMPFANSYYVSLFGVYHFKPVNSDAVADPYLSFGAFYRYSYYRNATIRFDDYEVGEHNVTQTEYHYIPGMKILSGCRIMLPRESKLKVLLDLYGGVGLRWKRQQEIVHSQTSQTDQITHHYNVLPSLHFGLKAGVAW